MPSGEPNLTEALAFDGEVDDLEWWSSLSQKLRCWRFSSTVPIPVGTVGKVGANDGIAMPEVSTKQDIGKQVITDWAVVSKGWPRPSNADNVIG